MSKALKSLPAVPLAMVMVNSTGSPSSKPLKSGCVTNCWVICSVGSRMNTVGWPPISVAVRSSATVPFGVSPSGSL
ncbi:hypothetical protein D3C76_829470 [compost metagenome]